MQFTLDYVINPIIVFGAAVGGALVVLVINKGRQVKSQRRIRQLENEMISSHAEILETQKAYIKMEARLKEQSIPVIPMNINGKENNPKEKASK